MWAGCQLWPRGKHGCPSTPCAPARSLRTRAPCVRPGDFPLRDAFPTRDAHPGRPLKDSCFLAPKCVSAFPYSELPDRLSPKMS